VFFDSEEAGRVPFNKVKALQLQRYNSRLPSIFKLLAVDRTFIYRLKHINNLIGKT